MCLLGSHIVICHSSCAVAGGAGAVWCGRCARAPAGCEGRGETADVTGEARPQFQQFNTFGV